MATTSSIQRITGTNSGLDVDALVKASMTSYQSKIDKENQNKTLSEYQQQQYQQIMKDASDFNDKYFDITKTGSLLKTATYQAVSFTSGDSSKVTAKGFAGADVNNYKVTTTQMAQKAIASFKATDLSSGTATNLNITFQGKSINPVAIVKSGGVVDMATTTKNLNTQLSLKGINVTAKYSEFSNSIVLESGTMGGNTSFTAGIDASTKTYTGQNAKGVISNGTDIYNIDQASNVVNLDNVQFTINAPSTSTSGSDLNDLVAGVNGATASTDGNTITSADGNTTTVKSNGGDTITTTEVDPSTGAVTKTVTTNALTSPTKTTNVYGSVALTGSSDVTALKDTIVKFVNDYNKILGEINTKLFETRDRSYVPLTDDQKSSMKDDEITAWNKKVQTGLLRNDSDLERIAASMKSAMSGVMSGSGLYLEKIGIEPVKDYAEKNGTYTVDESKLTQALQDNAGNIKDLFTRPASTTDKNDKGGIFTRLSSTLNDEFKSSNSALSKKAGLTGTSTQYSNTITKSINERKKTIADLNTKFKEKQNALYTKYSNLETALEKLNSQKSQLSSMLGTS
jgi:flagellar hook-associated protein 2